MKELATWGRIFWLLAPLMCSITLLVLTFTDSIQPRAGNVLSCTVACWSCYRMGKASRTR